MNFTNKVIWITGASSGIGKALALQLSNLDCKLILSSRRESELNIVKSQCNNPNNVAILAFDLADYDMMKPLAKNAISIFGSIDILINNGGISQRSLIIDTDISVDKKLISIHQVNPKFILRNYMAQEAIDASEDSDFSKLETLIVVLTNPFEEL